MNIKFRLIVMNFMQFFMRGMPDHVQPRRRLYAADQRNRPEQTRKAERVRNADQPVEQVAARQHQVESVVKIFWILSCGLTYIMIQCFNEWRASRSIVRIPEPRGNDQIFILYRSGEQSQGVKNKSSQDKMLFALH